MADPGVVTQKRYLPIGGYRPNNAGLVKLPASYKIKTGPVTPSSVDLQAPVQSTTSYRGSRSDRDLLNSVEGMLAYSQRKFWSPYDNGHEFTTWKERFAMPKLFSFFGRNGTYYIGPVLPNAAFSFLADNVAPRFVSPSISVAEGTKFLNQLRPTKSAANVAQALGELLVDLPKIPFDALQKAHSFSGTLRKGSEEYLNYVFGWAPLVSDVLKYCKAVASATDIIGQYERDSGKEIRRRANHPWSSPVTTTVTSTGAAINLNETAFSDLYLNASDARGTLTTTTKYTEKYSFSGAFMYLLTGDETFLGKLNYYASLANKLLGVKLDIEVMWELAPWSWLADWFADFGSLIALNNSIASDNLVIRYGYLMRHSRQVTTWKHSGVTINGSFRSGTISSVYSIEKKERIRATPYGFGIDINSLTASQWAILGALGLTKAPKRFWWG